MSAPSAVETPITRNDVIQAHNAYVMIERARYRWGGDPEALEYQVGPEPYTAMEEFAAQQYYQALRDTLRAREVAEQEARRQRDGRICVRSFPLSGMVVLEHAGGAVQTNTPEMVCALVELLNCEFGERWSHENGESFTGSFVASLQRRAEGRPNG